MCAYSAKLAVYSEFKFYLKIGILKESENIFLYFNLILCSCLIKIGKNYK